jgi:hypothetical protein
MNTDKIKRKIAEGHTDEEIAAMAGTTADEVNKLRAPAPAAPKAEEKKSVPKKPKKKK